MDASTIARLLLSGEARRGDVPTERIATYRELVRLHTQLSDDLARYKNEIHAFLIVLFPEFTQVFADPSRPTALGLLKRYRSRASHGCSWSAGYYQYPASTLWTEDSAALAPGSTAVGK